MLDAPTTLSREIAREPSLAIDPVEHRLRVRDDGFDLDDDERAGGRVEAEDVDGPALAPDGERRFDLHGPTRCSQAPNDGFHDRGVVLIEQAVERLAAPSEPEIHLGTECDRGTDDRTNRDAGQLAAVDQRDQRSREAGLVGDVLLALALANPKGPELATESELVHLRIIGDEPSPAVIRRRRRPRASFDSRRVLW